MAVLAGCGVSDRPGDLRRLEATVTGLLGGELVLELNGAREITVKADGVVTLGEIPSGNGYRVVVKTQPTIPAQVCTVVNGVGTMGASDVTDVAISCVGTHQIGGIVTGLAHGTSFILRSSLGENLLVGANGSFLFPTRVPPGTAYTVTVLEQPKGDPRQICAVTSDAGTVGASDAYGLVVDCEVAWASVSAGYEFSLAIKVDGSLWAFGYNGFGQLGDGTTTDLDRPRQVAPGTTWASVSAGNDHALAIASDGGLWAWGWNCYGQIGAGTLSASNCGAPYRGDPIPPTVPIQVVPNVRWDSVAAGDGFSLAIAEASIVDGTQQEKTALNEWGRLTSRTTPDLEDHVSEPFGWSSISAGAQHIVGITAGGMLSTWGESTLGQLGRDPTVENPPGEVGTDKDWKSVSAGHYHSLAIKTDGTLWSWGDNEAGQLGDGTTVGGVTPRQVLPGTSWVAISGGGSHTLGIQSDGSLWGWGANRYGQLGDGTTTGRLEPVRVLAR